LAREQSASVGRALREARTRVGLRLADVRRLSNGRFSPTTVAGYERAERSITIERFVELCDLYQVEPERLLAQIRRDAAGRPPVTLDRGAVERSGDGGEVLRAFVDRIVATRPPSDGSISVRAGDVDVLAAALRLSPAEFVDAYASAEGPAHADR
jgi:transcriptional regulator with XRE-family HTH domain